MVGLDVDPGARDELLRRTQGWMAGLRLAAMAGRADPEPGVTITDLAGDEPMVTDYLWDEVLVKQGPARACSCSGPASPRRCPVTWPTR